MACPVFAELMKAPEHVHTSAFTPLSIWNACAASVTPDALVGPALVRARIHSRRRGGIIQSVAVPALAWGSVSGCQSTRPNCDGGRPRQWWHLPAKGYALAGAIDIV